MKIGSRRQLINVSNDASTFDDCVEDDNHHYIALFVNHPEGKGLLRVERGELPWPEIKFDSEFEPGFRPLASELDVS